MAHGDDCDNATMIVHRQVGGDVGVSYGHHHGTNGISTTSTEITMAQFADVRVAALQSQAAFDTAMAAKVGATWYGNRPTGWKADARVHTRRYDPSAA